MHPLSRVAMSDDTMDTEDESTFDLDLSLKSDTDHTVENFCVKTGFPTLTGMTKFLWPFSHYFTIHTPSI